MSDVYDIRGLDGEKIRHLVAQRRWDQAALDATNAELAKAVATALREGVTQAEIQTIFAPERAPHPRACPWL